MLRTILSGEDLPKLLERENQFLTAAQAQQQSILNLDLNKLTPEAALEALGTQSMFASQRLVRISNLEKVRSPKALATLLEALENSSDDVLITVPAALTPAKKKLFGAPWKVENFPLPAVLFQFLEGLKLQPYKTTHALAQKALTSSSGSEWGLHAMLARQLRLLLAAKTRAPVAGPPFLINKLKKQTGAFTEVQLANALGGLYELERQVKSGQTRANWSQLFDIWLHRLYD